MTDDKFPDFPPEERFFDEQPDEADTMVCGHHCYEWNDKTRSCSVCGWRCDDE